MKQLSLQLDKPSYAPGASQQVMVQWSGAQPGEKIELHLLWYTQGKGTEDIGVVAQETWSSINASGNKAMTFTLPTFPWSFSGTLISLTWAIEAHAVKADLTQRSAFILSPTEREIVLKK